MELTRIRPTSDESCRICEYQYRLDVETYLMYFSVNFPRIVIFFTTHATTSATKTEEAGLLHFHAGEKPEDSACQNPAQVRSLFLRIDNPQATSEI
jgi:hypothetical protein